MYRFEQIGYGTPMAWVFDANKQILIDENGDILNKYITKFVYHSKEEEDDECTIEFYMPNVKMLDLDYFQQDRILYTQWGYITPYNTAIKSPIRKIAIRDIETEYDENGIRLKLTCTDLVSYLKSIANRKIAKYSKVDPGDAEQLRLSKKVLDSGFALAEVSARGEFSVSEYEGNLLTVTGKDGRSFQSNITYDKNGKIIYRPPGPAASKESFYKKKPGEPYQNKAKSSLNKVQNKYYERALRDTLELKRYQQNQKDKAAADEGKIIVDGTDDIVTIKRRDFSQPVWRSFNYMSEPGIIKSFKPRTLTRLEKKDISATTAVNPYKKRIENTDLLSIDSKNLEKYVEASSDGKVTVEGDDIIAKMNRKNLAAKDNVSKAAASDILQGAFLMDKDPMLHSSSYKANYPSWSYEAPAISTEVNEYGVPSLKPVTVRMTLPSSEIINSPYWNQLYKDQYDLIKSKYGAATPKLTGYTIEKTIRKYEATLEVVGDPSIVKGKIISLNGFSKKDSGKYYILKVRHEITVGSEYLTKIDLMQNPTTVGIKAKKEIVSLKVEKTEDTKDMIEVIRDYEETDSLSYNEEDNTKQEDIDNVPQNAYIGSSSDDIEERINFVNAEEDFSMAKNLDGLNKLGIIKEVS